MAAIRYCGDHGHFDADGCPTCNVSGELVLSSQHRKQLSKFLSGLLRHFPADYDLSVDDRGWADLASVKQLVTDRYAWADSRSVEAVITLDPKGRFEVDAGQLRVAYGHSIDITLETTREEIPDVLYHGTSPSALEEIREAGLQPMDRQLVHLSGTVHDARAVGIRHAADPVILIIDAASMLTDGYEIEKRGTSVYTTEHVAPTYLDVHDSE